MPEDIDPHCKLYDYDLSSHVNIILDWTIETGITKFVAHHHSDGDNKPSSILVNGLGRFQEFKDGNNTLYAPTARFFVEQVCIDM